MPDPSALLTANPYTAIPGVALGIAQTVSGLVNAHKAKVEAKNLAASRPKREIYQGYKDDLSLTESELAGGMSEAAKKAYNDALDREGAGSLSTILRGGGDVNNVSEVFGQGEEGRQRLALLTDQLRLKQIDNVMKARETMGDEVAKNFFWNQTKPWEDKSAANAKAREDATKAIWSGLSSVAGGGMNFLSNNTSNPAKSSTSSAGESPQNIWGVIKPLTSTDQGENTNRPSAYSTPNFNQNTQSAENNFQVPDYMNDPNWWQKI